MGNLQRYCNIFLFLIFFLSVCSLSFLSFKVASYVMKEKDEEPEAEPEIIQVSYGSHDYHMYMYMYS